jgi:hypothetical protein
MKYVWLLAALGFLWLDVLWMVYTHQMAPFNVVAFFACLFLYGLACHRIGRRRRKENMGQSNNTKENNL